MRRVEPSDHFGGPATVEQRDRISYVEQRDRISYEDTWAVCTNCGHKLTYHGHVSDRLTWVVGGCTPNEGAAGLSLLGLGGRGPGMRQAHEARRWQAHRPLNEQPVEQWQRELVAGFVIMLVLLLMVAIALPIMFDPSVRP